MINPWMVMIFLLPLACAQAAPPPGHPSVDQAARILDIPQDDHLLPFDGRVLEAFDSNNYVYIRVSMANGKEMWLAAPRVTLQEGQRIRFGQGTLMRNFYSRVHRRTFESILFVNGVLPEPP